ncbi:MAG: DNA-3-methyladenine glycosylase [candidate division WWE3 bacterium]|nr:DNA-3-methyladenine glycosylase [candidate division WWE3 bacterium]
MMAQRLNRRFFARPAAAVAPELLGKFLVRRMPNGSLREGMIAEVEAYVGVEDLASHAAGGRRTARNEVMYGPPGHAYVYFTYGMHWLLNVVCSGRDDPQAVMIRSLEIVSGDSPAPSSALVRGPARLTKFLEIDRKLNGEDLVESRALWIEDRGVRTEQDVIAIAPRIGVDYAKEWKDKPLRFVLPPMAAV